MEAEVEHRYDEYERLAFLAFMIEKAHRMERLKISDLFERPKEQPQAERKSIAEMRKEVDELNAWLASLTTKRKG